MNIKILVATHKPYQMPKDTSLYLPIQVGCDEVTERFGFQGDNTGDNISYKHRYYSDVSAIYWGWKNLDVDYMGAFQYRRYFASNAAKQTEDKLFRYILSREEVEALLQKCPLILPRKRHYYIESFETHYGHTHNPRDFSITRQVIQEICPEYLDAFNQVAAQKSGHICNMFIMRKDLLDQFCSFMFPILFEVEKRVDFTGYDVYESRVCGYMAEFMMDTWIIKNNIPYQEVKLVVLEKQHWPKKILNFLKTKFFPSTRVFREELEPDVRKETRTFNQDAEG